MYASCTWILAQQDDNCHDTKQDFDDIFRPIYDFRTYFYDDWQERWTTNYMRNKEYIDGEWYKMMHFWRNRQYFETGMYYMHCIRLLIFASDTKYPKFEGDEEFEL